MVAMTVSTGLPLYRPLTNDDLEPLPDDGHRYELLDGALLVTPAPAWEHQEVGASLLVVLREACPPHVRVLGAPVDVTFGRSDTTLQPDVLIARYADFGPKKLPAIPLLVAEVRSPSTAMIDRTLKKAAYARFGVPSYWILDPAARTLVAYELVGDEYVQVASVGRGETFVAEKPYPVSISIDAICRGLDPDPE
jgi:Uma2 family endonuclease